MPISTNQETTLLIAEWPEDLAARWHKQAEKSRISAANLRPIMKAIERVFGEVGPQMPTRAKLRVLIEASEANDSPIKIVHQLRSTYEGLLILWPEVDWRWVNDIVKSKRQVLWEDHPKWAVNQRVAVPKIPTPLYYLPVENWPHLVREKWLALKSDGAGGTSYRSRGKTRTPLDKWSDAYIARIERGLGRYLKFATQEQLSCCPNDGSVEHWLNEEARRGSAPVSIASYCFEAWRASSLIWSAQDWNWLSALSDDLKREAVPVRSTFLCDVSLVELKKLGIDLKQSAFEAPPTMRNILRFRDGLIISLLTEKPLRLKNLAALAWRDFDYDSEGRALVTIGKTKNGDVDCAYLSAELSDAIKFWYDDLRPRLGPDPHTEDLWIGAEGKTLSLRSLSRQICVVTKRHLGVSVSPHKFRNALAQTIALNAPSQMAVASRLLGHRDRGSTSHYEGMARSAGASKMLGDILIDYRMPPAFRAKPIR